MKVLQRYLAREIIRSVIFVLVAFLSLFAFFDLMNELQSVGRGGYKLQHAFAYVVLGMPGYVYELMPIAALIGTIYVLSQMAARSEFTIMRVSGLSTVQAGRMLALVAVFFTGLTFLFGEVISPRASDMAERLKLELRGTALSKQFRSGLWAKDVVRENGISGRVMGSRFLNVREVRFDGELLDLTIYEFDRDFRMTRAVTAARAQYAGANTWNLAEVAQTMFPVSGASLTMDELAAVKTQKFNTSTLVSEVTPDILAVLFADPDRMSAYDLAAYTRHLADNQQRTERYEIAYWKKLTYPFAVFVMMALALPFAYMQVRAGGVSLKIFAGIMLGVSFQLVNSLFGHIGLLNTWPPLATAVLPSLLFLLVAIGSLAWVERR
ncbi:LPS export ABC transporter permease LptG [Lacisediminimonas sp.]|uniref:LPS export ABC transporter permease LptG n=1 Tax=Lacisediminimonas sp. TaxID=3060582 RepID=UPI00272230DC|nr:LPS export ABC transporter permease LptG [Lacisediminimonas sp.]MDO8298298.1 LPS export ABC transporter permease LptG [Lacisediminimonas sp.]